MSIRVKPIGRYLRRKARHARAFLMKGAYKSRRELKLNLGCGGDKRPGYVNIDANPDSNADLFLDFRRINRAFRPDSISEIMMIHSINYLNLWQAQALFREFHGLLKSGGKVIMELPDLGKCMKRILEASQVGRFTPEYLEGVRGLYAFGLDNLKAKKDYHPYAFGWSDWHLKNELENVGFVVVIAAPQTHDNPWRDIRVEATKS